jgi:WD40 repeat protein
LGRKVNRFEAAPRAFISYARSDGEETAAWLRTRLEKDHPEITLWLDRAQMVAGLGWWKQITEALDKVEILIMVLTPGATGAEIAAKEWRYARQQGVRVCPVTLDASTLNFKLLPAWIRRAHCYDLQREWETFVGYLHSPGKTNRVPFMAPDLPEKCVERSAELETLLELLLEDSRESARAVATALHGSGGFGKTTLACMLCHHDKIISAFDDGILWVTLGEVPNIQGELTKLYAALTGDRPPFVDIDDASIQLSTHLESTTCLIVIDDVWDPNHLKPFLRGGTRCSRIITTRQLSVLSGFGINRTPVDRMTLEEAVQMLLARIPSASGEVGKLRAIAERLGNWPLLLKLASSQLNERIERGDSLNGALAYVERALDKRGIVAFDRAGRTARGDAVASTVAASLEQFSAEDQLRCAELAIFRGDSAFPLTAACTLWDLDEFDSEALMLRFDDAALLEFDLKIANVRIHNVLRSYLETRMGSAQNLHARLVSRWLRRPLELPDVYAWTWIGWHLAQARQLEQLKLLLLDFDWVRTRMRVVSIQIALQDFKFIADSSDGCVVRDALILAADGLALDYGQLRIQLCGRIERGRSLALDRLLDQADRSEPKPRLDLAERSLTHPGGALTAILKSHLRAVEVLTISPSNQWIVSGSWDWTLRLWDLERNSVLRTFEGHQGTVHAVAFAPDGLTILSASEDRTLRLWELATGKLLQIFAGHTLPVLGVAIAGDSEHAYSASEDGSVREWNLTTGVSKTLFKGDYHQLGPIAVTQDGRRLIFGAGDSTIRVMDMENQGATQVFEGQGGVVRSLALSRDNSRVVSGHEDGLVRVWMLDTGTHVVDLAGHRDAVKAVVFFGSGADRVISGSNDRTLCLWNLETGQALRVLKGHSGFVRAIAVSSVTADVYSGSTDCTIRRWNVESGSTDSSARGHAGTITRLAISSDGCGAVSGSGDSDMLVWSTVPAEQQRLLPSARVPASSPTVVGRLTGHTDRINAVDLSEDGDWAVTASRDKTLRMWNLRQVRGSHVFRGHTREVLDIQISVDGSRVVSFARDRTVRVWEMRTGRAIRVLVSEENERARVSLDAGSAMIAELGTGPLIDVCAKPIPQDARIAISPDGSCVVIGCQRNVRRWDLRTGTTDNKRVDDFDAVTMSFAPDSRSVIVGSLAGPLLLWPFEQDPMLLEGHTGTILDIMVTPDGRKVISAATDDTIRIWDLATGRQERQVKGYVGRADAVAIAHHGNLAYVIYGHVVVAYDLSACTRIGSLSFDHQITAISVTPSGMRTAIGDQSGRVHFLNIQT